MRFTFSLRAAQFVLQFVFALDVLQPGTISPQEWLKPPAEIKPLRVATTAERGSRDWIDAAAFLDRLLFPPAR